MGLVTVSRALRLLELAVVVVLIAAVVVWFRDRGPRAEVVVASAATGFQTISYEGVRVDIPDDWERSDQSGCEFEFEHWGPAGSSACSGDPGVSFYGSATFDPCCRPGIRPARPDSDDPPWGGYAYAGDYAVHVAGHDRDLLEQILDTARPRPRA